MGLLDNKRTKVPLTQITFIEQNEKRKTPSFEFILSFDMRQDSFRTGKQTKRRLQILG
jgi:hypothetical protein